MKKGLNRLNRGILDKSGWIEVKIDLCNYVRNFVKEVNKSVYGWWENLSVNSRISVWFAMLEKN